MRDLLEDGFEVRIAKDATDAAVLPGATPMPVCFSTAE